MDGKVNSYQFQDMYEAMGIKTSELGCIMLDIEPFKVTELVENGADDLYFDANDGYQQGAVAEEVAHVTLLYGLMQNGNDISEFVDRVLEGWSIKTVEVDKVDFFDIEGQDYYPIIARAVVSDELLEGNARLRLLPHIDTFPEYHPHVTLAYIKKDDATRDKWIKALGAKFNGSKMKIKPALNYGSKSKSLSNMVPVDPLHSGICKALRCKGCNRFMGMAYGTVVAEMTCKNTKCKMVNQFKIVSTDRVDDIRFRFPTAKIASRQ